MDPNKIQPSIIFFTHQSESIISICVSAVRNIYCDYEDPPQLQIGTIAIHPINKFEQTVSKLAIAMIVVTTIQQALRPFLVMCFIVGLGFYPGKQPRIWWTAYLSILYSLTLWFTYAYLFYYIIILFKIEILFRTSVVIIVTEINIFTLVVSVIMSFYHRKRFATCLKKLAAVDDTLEELGTPKMYRKIYIWSKRIVIVWIMYSMTVNVYESLLWQNLNETVSWGLYLPYILNHSLHINTLVDLLFTFILWYIGTRFDKISEHIRYLSVREEHGLKCTWKKPVVGLHRYIMCTDNHKRILWISMHLHLELCHLARELNSIFGTQITFEMASYLLYLTALCYYLCLMLIRKQSDEEIHSAIFYLNLFNTGLWLFLFLFKLYTINTICENVTVKANKNDKVIHQLTSVRQYANISEKIHQFTLQTMQHPLKFSGMGLFYFGNTFLRKFCMTVITYVIIMMQLKIT